MTPSPPAGCRSREVARGLLLGFEPVNSDSRCTPFPVDSIGHVALHVAVRIVTVTLSPQLRYIRFRRSDRPLALNAVAALGKFIGRLRVTLSGQFRLSL